MIQSMVLGVVFTIVAGFMYLVVLIPLRFYEEDDVKLLHFLFNRSPLLRKQLVSFLDFLSKIILRKK